MKRMICRRCEGAPLGQLCPRCRHRVSGLARDVARQLGEGREPGARIPSARVALAVGDALRREVLTRHLPPWLGIAPRCRRIGAGPVRCYLAGELAELEPPKRPRRPEPRRDPVPWVPYSWPGAPTMPPRPPPPSGDLDL